jgi:hypothetical protein
MAGRAAAGEQLAMTKSIEQVPSSLERLAGWLTPAAEREFLLGDLAESYAVICGKNGRFSANCWYAGQLVRSLPAFFQLQATRWWVQRSFVMKAISKRESQHFLLGLMLLIPAVLIVIPGLISSFTGWSAPMNAIFDFLQGRTWLSWVIHPAVILGSLLVAFLLNGRNLFEISLRQEPEAFIGTLALRKGRWLSLSIVLVTVLFVTVIFLYLLAEHFAIFGL